MKALQCLHCDFNNPEGLDFCLNCASPLSRLCPVCGENFPDGYRFCGHCGYKIEQESKTTQLANQLDVDIDAKRIKLLNNLQSKMPAQLTKKIAAIDLKLVGQRRDVTVLLADLVNFTEMTTVLGNEETFIFVERLMRYLAEIVYTYEGTIDKFTGDGLMAIFGLPINHENDPERAIRAGFEMHTAVDPFREQLKLSHNLDTELRIGINTGHVIAGKLGDQFHMEYTVIGDTVNLASRLEAVAKPGTTLVSFRTYQRTRPIFVFDTLPPMLVKGNNQPVIAYQPLSIRLKPGQVRGLQGLSTPMVGRGTQFEILQKILAFVETEQDSRMVLVSGEAGLGKSRLISEFRRHLMETPVQVYEGTCASFTRVVPYRVVGDIIRNIIHVADYDPEDLQREILLRHLEMLGLETQNTFPYILHVLGVAQADPILQSRLSLLNPDMLQKQIFSALRSFLIAQTGLGTTVFVFEDLHWVDPVSRKFIEYFSLALGHDPLLLILVSRKFDSTSLSETVVETLKNQKKLTDIRIQPLSEPNSIHLLDQLIPERSEEINDIKGEIVNRAVGNPYYMEEIVRALLEQKGLLREGMVWRATPASKSILKEIPGTLQDIIIARFDNLSNELRELLQKSSLLGETFEINLLSDFLNIDHETLMQKLIELETRDFIVQTTVDIYKIFQFKHPLIQETIYQNILSRDLRRFHSEIGFTIENGSYWLPEEKNEILALHYTKSDTPEKAIPYLLLAAEIANRKYANESAVEHYQTAIGLLKDLPMSENNTLQILKAQIGLGQALKFLGTFDEGAKVLLEAIPRMLDRSNGLTADLTGSSLVLIGLRELADIRTREGLLDQAIELLQSGLGLLGENGYETHKLEWRRLSDRIAWVYFRQGKLDDGFKLADLSLMDVDLKEVDDPITIASLHNTLGGIYWQWAKKTEAIEHVEKSLNIYESLNYYWGVAIAYTNLGILHYAQGKWNQAVSYFEKADALRKEQGYPSERPTNLKNLGELLIHIGNLDLAREKLEQSRGISLSLGMSQIAAYAELGLSRLSLLERKIEEAAKHLEIARNLTKDEKPNDLFLQYSFLFAMVKMETDEVSEGLEIALSAYEQAVNGGFSEEKTEGALVLGMLYTRVEKLEEAQKYLDACLQYCDENQDHFRKAQVLLELARLNLIQANKSGEDNRAAWLTQSNKNIEKARSIFENLGAAIYLREIGFLKNQIMAASPPQSTVRQRTPFLNPSEVEGVRKQLSIPQGEWHNAAILHLSFSQHDNTDDELAFETMALISPSIVEIIEEMEGKYIKKQDSLTVVFGTPISHEDDPERAIETAIELSNYFQALSTQVELPFSVSYAITKGEVVAGYVKLGEGKGQFLVAGDPVQEADILANAASPGRVWVSQSVRDATAHRFIFSIVPSEYLSPLTGLPVTQLEGLRDQMLPVRGLIGIKTPLVGRESELHSMERFNEVLQKSSGGIIWISGDSGIGKSRLMQEYASTLKPAIHLTWRGFCVSRRSDRAFSLFHDLLMNVFDIPSNVSAEEVSRRIDKMLSSYASNLMDSAIYFHFLLGSFLTPDQEKVLSSLEPEQLQRQIFVAVRKLIEKVSDQQPLGLLLDDLQWVDPISADLLLFISTLILSHPILIVVTQRNEISPVANKIRTQLQKLHQNQFLHVSLQPFSATECKNFLRAIIPGTDLPEEMLKLISRQSGGNPYFIEEFIRMLIEKGFLRVEKGKLAVQYGMQLDSLSIPASLELLLRSRIDSLPSPAKKLLQVASIIGHQIDPELLRKVSQEPLMDNLLLVLQNRGMVNLSSDGSHWEFTHFMIETTVYHTLLLANRKQLHLKTAQIIESELRKSESDYIEELAYQFDRAGEKARAVDYFVLVAEKSASQYANEEALLNFVKASDYIEELGLENDDYHWRIAMGLGKIYQFTGDFESSMEIFRSALKLTERNDLPIARRANIYRQLGDTLHKKGDQELAIEHLFRALEILQQPEAPADFEELIPAYTRLGWCYFFLGDFSKALEAGKTARGLLINTQNLNVVGLVENLLGGIFYRMGELDRALLHLTRAKETWEEIGYGWGIAASYSNMGILEVTAGNWPAAFAYFERSLNLRQNMGDVEGVAITNNNLGRLSCDQGKLDMAEMYFLDSLAIARPFQISWQIANSTAGLAQTYLYKGQFQKAEETHLGGIAVAEEIGAMDILSELKIIQAEIWLAKGLYSQALEAAVEAVKSGERTGNRLFESWCWRIASACLLKDGKIEEAERTLQKSWIAVEDGGEKLEIGRVNAQAAAIQLALGKYREAEKYFTAADEIFTTLGAEHDLSNLNDFKER